MELRQLRAFALAAQTMNFSEAADKMCVTQSTFSQTIKSLEQELKVELFHRNSHEVTLTEAGREILPFAQNTLQQAKYCEDRVLDLMQLRCGTLNIGVTHSFKIVASDAIMLFIRTYPNIRLMVYYKTMRELLEMLEGGEVDCVLSYKPDTISDDIESHTLFDDRLSAVVGISHPIASAKSIALSELKRHSLALPAKGMQARNILDQICHQRGIDLQPRLEINEVTPLLQLVQTSSMVTVLSRSSIEGHNDLKAIPIEGSEGLMTGSFHVLRDAYRKHSMKAFVDILVQATTVHKRMGLLD
ncbi:MAG: LysR family transcriptional regulator [Bacteroidales bacterium]|nr:LysR family transcriptional regulator [Bacteroidales bacterium]